MGDERRRLQRYKLAVPVRFDGSEGLTRDLSATGVYFETDAVIEEGAILELEIAFNQPLITIQCKGTVVRVDEQGSDRGVAVSIDAVEF